MPHCWPRPGWMGLSAAWSSGRCSLPCQGDFNWIVLNVPSNPNQPMTRLNVVHQGFVLITSGQILIHVSKKIPVLMQCRIFTVRIIRSYFNQNTISLKLKIKH